MAITGLTPKTLADTLSNPIGSAASQEPARFEPVFADTDFNVGEKRFAGPAFSGKGRE